MSLEANLELNNQLLTQHNALLEKLITALAAGAAIQPAAVTQVQEYRETLAENKPAGAVIKPVTLDDLAFSDIIALANFAPGQSELTPEVMQRVIAYRDAEGDKRIVQIDALDSALLGVKRAKELHKEVLLQLANAIVSYWDDLPTIADRRAYAETWLDVKPDEREAVKPKKAGNKGKNPERKGPFFWKHPESSAFGTVEDLSALNEILEDGLTVEINKVEYLQLKKEAEKTTSDTDQPDFAALRKQAEGLILQLAKGGYRSEAIAILESQGAKKLGEVTDENLAAVVEQAEKALEG